MPKEFEIAYVDKTDFQTKEHVIAFDASQAQHAFVHTHPESNILLVSCNELAC